jgi:hypothetical protein
MIINHGAAVMPVGSNRHHFGVPQWLIVSVVIFSCAIFLSGCLNSSESATEDTFLSENHAQDPNNSFLGKERADVKTSFLDSPADTFTNLKALFAALPSDEFMHALKWRDDSPRTKSESRVICLTDVYIFAVIKEDDNDYHVVLGSVNDVDADQVFFTAEIAGLPDSGSKYFATLTSVRTDFKNQFRAQSSPGRIFLASSEKPPIHLRSITGSLFFDNHHYGGYGAKHFRTTSVWEIHPVTSIRFDPIR